MDVENKKSLPLDIIFILSVAALIFLTLSIYSYSSSDPSFSHIIFSDYELRVNNLFGKTGAYFADLTGTFFGWAALCIPVFFTGTVYRLYLLRSGREEGRFGAVYSFMAMTVFVFLLSVMSGFFGGHDFFFDSQYTGGISGKASSDILVSFLGRAGGMIVTFFLLVISFMLFFAVTLSDMKQAFLRVKTGVKDGTGGRSFRGMFINAGRTVEAAETESAGGGIYTEPDEGYVPVTKPLSDDYFEPVQPEILPEPMEEDEEVFEVPKPQANGIDIKPKETVEQTSVKYDVPLSLLDKPSGKIKGESDEELKHKASILEQKLKDFGVLGKVREIRPGPVVTLFEFEPAPGIKINKIANLSDDLALAMSALSVRIIAPIPGKSVVGIELPNENRESVVLSELLTSLRFAESQSPLTFAMGKDASGKPYISDLTKMPHLLIAGTTGSGKSVSVNAMICSVLYKSSPRMVKFVMIDPKMVELSIYEGIPHLAAPVVVDVRKAATVLKNVVQEMESRYSLLAESKVRNIDSYNQKSETDGHPKMPYLIVVVDEFADLMMVAGKEVEQSIIRIAQMARAVGIHLILATQRPSVNVITGIIKANMPARLSFKVSSKIDSRTVIDSNGAELLLGKGDSLFIPPGTSETVRVHGCFVSDDEVGRITEHLKTLGEPEYNMDLVKDEDAGLDEIDESEIDDKYFEALELVRQKGFASISMIQRYLRIGYNRAARIVEIMEQKGIVAPSDGTSKPREVLKRD
ncbi:DNA translocase FtsK [Geovibrio thiophilus]|uniref:DNA translocase FtsK n=1 Tax=Geovibrio thiophilus TaxID=139438 RepID=A0A3R5UTS9_9BACT|nr:DNA translocase FtsK 4TM domain-containing protein [Geovibrio thiophilus]QAR32289.1 DNA translocase FtsK [Geovibrio thiophilus]